MIRSLIILATACVAVGQASAQSLVDGDPKAGEDKSLACAACHGANGISVNPEWPNLAGQHAGYIEVQLHAFKEMKRVNALMNGQAMILSDQDMKDLAVYFEAMDAPVQEVADPGLVARGESIYRGGVQENKAAACIACHGPTGKGNPAANYPVLAGQHATYTAKTLRDYASDERQSGEPAYMMQEIAKALSEEDIVAVSAYVQGLQERTPLPSRAMDVAEGE
ncbi:MAG: c-type cytochrome [Pseudomonadota bacterium]